MRKLSLRSEHLGLLSNDELRNVAGAAGGYAAAADGTVSDGSCVCHLLPAFEIRQCDISDGSCVCTR